MNFVKNPVGQLDPLTKNTSGFLFFKGAVVLFLFGFFFLTGSYANAITLVDAVDDTGSNWSTGGNANWFGETSVYYYGGDAAQSGDINDNQQSWIQTTFKGSGIFSFCWKVSSESNFDFLRFYLDGVEQKAISGEVDWERETYTLESGNHILKWIYIKDINVSSGSDCGWLDTAVFTSSGELFSEALSYFTVTPVRIYTNSSSCTVTINIKDLNGNNLTNTGPIYLQNSLSSVTIVNTNPSNAYTDVNGQCTFTIKSSVVGGNTITAEFRGKTIRENLVSNYSFEQGSGASPSPWTGDSGGGISNSVDTGCAHSGSRSYRIVGESRSKSVSQNIYNITPNSTYLMSAWSKAENPVQGSYYIQATVYYKAGSSDYCSGNFSYTTHDFEKVSNSFTTQNKDVDYIQFSLYYIWQTGTTWFDDVTLERIPTVNFINPASKLKIASSSFTTTKNNSSTPITVEARDDSGNVDVLFSGTIALSCSSNSGSFSVNNITWKNTTTIYLNKGTGTFYYKDSNTGNPIITVSRTGLTAGTQTETIADPVVNEVMSYLTANSPCIYADGISVNTVTVRINDQSGFIIANTGPISLQNTLSGVTIVNTNPSNAYTDTNGQCVFTIKSSIVGGNTIAAQFDGKTIRENLVSNFSFEQGSGASPSPWTTYGSGSVDSSYAHSGNCSYRMGGASWAPLYQNISNIAQNSHYILSAWSKAQDPVQWGGIGSYSLQAYVIYKDGNSSYYSGNFSSTTHDFEKVSISFATENKEVDYVTVSLYFSFLQGTVWFDDVALQKVPTVNFINHTSTLNITSSSFTTTKNSSSPAITVEARDDSGNVDVFFSGTITLTSSSNSCSFSVNDTSWKDTTTIYLNKGTGTFYYKDSNIGNPTITVSRVGVVSGSQTETVSAQVFNETYSRLTVSPGCVRTDGISTATVTVNIRDQFDNSISDTGPVNMETTLSGISIVDTNPSNAYTDANGQCTFTIKSSNPGGKTITAEFNGKTIRQNLISNYSFEQGSGASPPSWNTGNNGVIDSAYAHTGRNSYRIVGIPGQFKSISQRIYNITSNSTYLVSAWSKAENPSPAGLGYPYYCLEVEIYYEGGSGSGSLPGFSSTTHDFEKLSVSITTENKKVDYIKVALHYDNQTGTAWFDDIMLERVPNINFIGNTSRLKITSSPFTITPGHISSAITVEAQDDSGNVDAFFSGTVTLASSSDTGRFSIYNDMWGTNWQDTTTILLAGGKASFYYKDSNVCNPIITISSLSLYPDSQANIIATPVFNETISYLRVNTAKIPADGSSVCNVTVFISDQCGYGIAKVGPVYVSTSRGSSYDTVTGNPQITDNNGQCIFSIKSSKPGGVTITATYQGKTITENYVSDPSFEKGEYGFTNFSGSSIFAQDNNIFHSGSKSARITNYNYDDGTYGSGPHDIPGGGTYKCSLWYKTENVTGSGGVKDIIIYSYVYIMGGYMLGDSFTLPEGNQGTNPWTKLEATGTFCETATKTVGFLGRLKNANGTAWFDDVRLQRIPTIDFTGTIDETPPFPCSVVINFGDAYTDTNSITLTLSATDTLTGVNLMVLSNDNFATAETYTYSTPKAWILSSGDGVKTVYVKFIDGAGNTSQAVTDTIILDINAPDTPNLISPSGKINDITPVFSWSLSDTGSPLSFYLEVSDANTFDSLTLANTVSSYTYELANTEALQVNKTYYWRVTAKDVFRPGPTSLAHNFLIETQPPVVNIISPANASVVISCTVTLFGSVFDSEPLNTVTLYINDTSSILNLTAGNTFISTINLRKGYNKLQVAAYDQYGNIGYSDIVALFRTTFVSTTIDTNTPDTIVSIPGTSITIPQSTFSNTVVIGIISNHSSETITNANNAIFSNENVIYMPELEPTVYEYNAFKVFNGTPSCTQTITAPLNRFITITISYPPTIVSSRLENSLRIFYLDPITQRWVLTPDIQNLDKNNHTVSIATNHFSIYRLFTTSYAASDLSKVIVYPNPFKPAQTISLNFVNLTAQATIRIYNIAGELVRTIEKNDSMDKKTWDGKNDFGESVASGVYIYFIINPQDPASRAIGKIMVIR